VSITQAKATLRLRSDTATAAQVTHRLGLVPSFSPNAASRSHQGIRPGCGTGHCGCWTAAWTTTSHSTTTSPTCSTQLSGKHSALTDLAVSYDIDWFCLAATNNTQGSVELPHELIARLAAHPGDLVLDLYIGQDQS
jgi:hypothetical protein